MEKWKEEFQHLASKIENAFDKKSLALKQKLHLLDDITIQPYIGYGNRDYIHINGRVLEHEGLRLPEADDTLLDNIKTLYYRYESDEIPDAPLAYKLGSVQGNLTSDDEGYFSAKLDNPDRLEGWQEVEYTMLKQYKETQPPVRVKGEVLLQSSNSTLGLISDLDDTVIVSKATDFFEKSRIMLLNSERTRKPFEGVATFYRALQKGAAGHNSNPVFYVSSSSWNLYDMFKNFCEINQLPKGVFLLRDVGLDRKKLYRTGHSIHKQQKIAQVLETFRELSFLLIGDSGQHDPEIYLEIVKQYPGRIMGIYIRDVHPQENKPRDLEVKAITEQVARLGVPMLLVKNSAQAAQHAAEQGWIAEGALSEIIAEASEEEQSKHDVRHMLGLHKLFGQ
ncbi:hypothetical protein D770_03670 [Flammeovirgaceae bacterium 311]|nr:hypothetical protein D770_03670 [Flammeovirgaceae bacterium 311]